ncbi:hypothetical protein NFI96_005493 [Prochilodus magdalenae]|nr:hypothetical protein NFI96_005493 [Prochilodus magdalenae]
MSQIAANGFILLAVIGWIIAIIACFKPMWRSPDPKAGGQFTWEGLWERCKDSTEQRPCEAYNSVQPLPLDLQVSRKMIITAISMTVLPLALSIMGANCPSCKKNKVTVMIISGALFFLAGCLVLIPVTWIKGINKDFVERKLGASINMCFGAGSLLIAGGVLLCGNSLLWEERAITSSSTHRSKRMEIGGLTLGFIGWILAIGTCFLPMWRVTTSSGSSTYFFGPWMKCIMQSTDKMECKVYKPVDIFPFPGHRTACISTIISIALGVQALINFIRRKKGLFCCTYVDDDKTRRIEFKASKAVITSLAGVLYVIAGIVLVIPLSYFNTINDSKDSDWNMTQHSYLEASTYIGFAAAALLIIGGFLLCFSYFARSRD